MDTSRTWYEETEETLNLIHKKEGYILIMGVCFVYKTYAKMKSMFPNKEIYSIRIANGQCVVNFPLQELRPAYIYMPMSWGSVASVLDDPIVFDRYSNDLHLKILKRLVDTGSLISLVDFPAALDRYCVRTFCSLPAPRKQAESLGWSAQPLEEQLDRRERWKNKVIQPMLNDKVRYTDLLLETDKTEYIHNIETRDDLVSSSPWHWDDEFLFKITTRFHLTQSRENLLDTLSPI